NDQAGPDTEADEADEKHDRDRLEQRLSEAADRLFDDPRLIGDEVDADTDRQGRCDRAHFGLQRFAELQAVAALAPGGGQADRLLAVEAKQWLDRVYVAAVNLGDVGKPEELIADAEIDRFEALFGNELPADTD